MAEQATLAVPKDVIEPIIQAHVTSAVCAALTDQKQLVERAISRVLSQEVDSTGKPSSYSSDRERTWIRWVMEQAVRDATRAAITEHLAAHKEALRAAMAKELAKKNSPLVRQLIEGIVNSVTNPDVLKYRLSVSYDGK